MAKYKVYRYNREGQLRFWREFEHYPELLLDDPDFSIKYRIDEIKEADVIDFETYKLVNESFESIEGMEQMFRDALSWPEDKQEKFFKEAIEVLKPLVESLQEMNDKMEKAREEK